MTLTIDLSPALENDVRQQAARRGENVSDFVVHAVEAQLARTRTFEQVCAPIVQAVEAAGISDEECDRFFEEVREEVWQERQGQAS